MNHPSSATGFPSAYSLSGGSGSGAGTCAACYGALVGSDGGMRTSHNGQLTAYDRAREQLQGQLNPEQMNQFDRTSGTIRIA